MDITNLNNTIVEVFRTGVDNKDGYKTIVHITYFLDWAFIQGFSSPPTLQCHREIREHMRSRGITDVWVAKKDDDGSMRKVHMKINHNRKL